MLMGGILRLIKEHTSQFEHSTVFIYPGRLEYLYLDIPLQYYTLFISSHVSRWNPGCSRDVVCLNAIDVWIN